ncbi:hypothetical protein T4A_14343 [Trichinella pseudospiralis]|uniref:Uncharacterized protein n=1 Tax=Trichinella pseudospiralis TaxID=6337 RepID=A0A0V1DV84_TRIPS|nr:hypothetical protein T4A_12595 [Trichinella pseudospiralis]KRY75485.1 hypothetical protein T4A_14343 [Trichinella pseudospiralis]
MLTTVLSPLFVARQCLIDLDDLRKDDCERFVVNCWHPNRISHSDAHPLSRIAVTFDLSNRAHSASGYSQIEMNEEDAEKTAFATAFVVYQFKKLLASHQLPMEWFLACEEYEKSDPRLFHVFNYKRRRNWLDLLNMNIESANMIIDSEISTPTEEYTNVFQEGLDQ